ncbi:MAG: TraB/GumN family protein [Rubrivivax sp.]|nr:TraB/GumN family protein [Rubrivivax sp.]
MLWHVRDTNFSFLGSVHLASRPFTFPAKVESALEHADVLAFESNLDVAPDTTSGRYSKSVRLSQSISDSLYRDAAQLWASLALLPGDLERARPWLAAITLMNGLLSQHGYDPRHGVDRQVLNLGKLRRKTLFYLEDVNAGLLPFKQAPLPEQEGFLANAVRNTEESVRDVEVMINAWETRQPNELLPIAEKGRLRTPTIFAAAISGRNRKWLPKLLKLVRSGKRTVATVGALHLITAADSLPSLLAKHGYACELEDY